VRIHSQANNMTTTTTLTTTLTSDGRLQTLTSPYTRNECFLPAATSQCHASNLCFLNNGDLLCAWFGGSQEGKPDISIYMSRLKKSSEGWSKPAQMTFDGTRSEQNPVIFQTPSEEVWLLYTSQLAGNQDSAVVKRRVSFDGGLTWGEPTVLFGEQGTFIRQPLVVLENGTWVIPIFKCRTEPGMRWIGNDDISCVRASKDQGKTWTESEVPNSYGCVHMEIQMLKDKTYMAAFRSRWADHVYISYSPDGLTWDAPQPASLPNPNAGICFDVLPSGRVVVIYNHSSRADATGRREGLYDDIGEAGDQRKNQGSKHAGKEAFWGAPRAPLCIGWSDDRGTTWSHRTLQDGDGYCMNNNSERKENRELSYPSMVVRDGIIHVAFTFWRQKIKYLQLRDDIFDSWQ
jgi:predicted neuraminidase